MKRALRGVVMAALAACERTPSALPSSAEASAPHAAEASPSPPRPLVRVVVRGAAEDTGAAPSGAADGRTLAPGEQRRVSAEETLHFDVGLAARVSVTGPAIVASDPDGERRLYVLGGFAHAAVSPDPAARPFALELATPCGVLHVPRAAELDAQLGTAGVCSYARKSGTASLGLATENAENSAFSRNSMVRCAVGSGCVALLGDALPEASRGPVDPAAWHELVTFLATQLDTAANAAGRLRAGERRARARIRPGARDAEALALQRALALGAAEGLRARADVYRLRAVYRAAALAEWPSFAADPRESALLSALRAEP